MNQKRREALRLTAVIGLMAATGLISQAEAATWNKAAFEGKTLDDVLKSLGGSSADKSGAITINAPDIAENGAVVPVGVNSKIPNTDMVALLVDKNPNALAGAYQFMDGGVAEVNMRVKMGQSSDVFAIVRADGKFYMTKKEIKVTLGGCGG